MRGARTAGATAALAGLTKFRESIMSEREYITVRRMSRRGRRPVQPSKGASVFSATGQFGCLERVSSLNRRGSPVKLHACDFGIDRSADDLPRVI